ncbi:MAG: methyltransferase [Bacteroidales bacterium]|nr:methyltransferase [Bacteroidales bacterium]
MGVFQFKRFNVVNERSAMKVNTDGVLLGAAMTIRPDDRRLLDIGTGTGTIALMAAQRALGIPGQAGDDKPVTGDDEPGAGGDVMIDAIDIDEPSATEAAENFKASPWSDHLHVHNLSLQEFAETGSEKYDLIFSNPPYFEDSLTAPDERKSTARHTSDGLSYRDIFEFAAERLTGCGRVALVLPADQEAPLCRYARMCGLHMFRILRIRTVERKAPIRIIAEFSRERCQTPSDGILTIMNEGKYTQEYLSLTHDFYLFA